MTDDATDVAALAAALRADVGDLDTYAAVLTATLADALPAEMVEVERDRSVRDRIAGRAGATTAIRVRTGAETLELTRDRRGAPEARVVTEVRGVVIGRRSVSVGEWCELLAQHLAARAAESARARSALAALLGL